MIHFFENRRHHNHDDEEKDDFDFNLLDNIDQMKEYTIYFPENNFSKIIKERELIKEGMKKRRNATFGM